MFSVWSERAARGEFVGWIRYLSQCLREFIPKRRDSYNYMAMKRSANFSDEVTVGRKNNALNEKVGWRTADGDWRAERIDVCYR